eukprot:NODE_3636_length_942_cov_480.486002_g3339_i0.p1 GENE.NODE_3636_length_942_cov_480.486002_g3339_i0~~NODE_3636_length_942_cov_480.486002_g3339_i0.p1  ORF type:complete len:234 (-),score=32.69 NODE_3636_length_942_cov_480.486002_g3339_i0:162-863(-)
MSGDEYFRYRSTSLEDRGVAGRGFASGAAGYGAAGYGAAYGAGAYGAGAYGAPLAQSSYGHTSLHQAALPPVMPPVAADFGRGWNFLQYSDNSFAALQQGPMMTAPVWHDNLVLSETHYHHGDHHHNHHQRHIHHFHDLHLLGSAEETLDLRGNPPVQTHVIPSDNPPQLKLRPDILGRQAFEAGAEQYFGSLSQRFDQAQVGAAGAVRSRSASLGGGFVTEEEVEARRRYVS